MFLWETDSNSTIRQFQPFEAILEVHLGSRIFANLFSDIRRIQKNSRSAKAMGTQDKVIKPHIFDLIQFLFAVYTSSDVSAPDRGRGSWLSPARDEQWPKVEVACLDPKFGRNDPHHRSEPAFCSHDLGSKRHRAPCLQHDRESGRLTPLGPSEVLPPRSHLR
mmetsp:Transcript_9098/g.18428  ORF Transcript_9098/g.18428 Transcript_9098/m.18428 type:complete len:163 (-) Transcript_9098:1823-2311(-)